MKCQILFSGKNKKNIINLPSAENAQRVVKVKDKKDIFKSINRILIKNRNLSFKCNLKISPNY